MSKKTDFSSFQELSNQSSRLHQEIVETNKKQSLLSTQFTSFAESFELQRTHYQLDLLEKRLSTVEGKVDLEPVESEIEFGEAVKLNTIQPPSRKTRLRLTDIIGKGASNESIRRRQRFDTIIRNKKLS